MSEPGNHLAIRGKDNFVRGVLVGNNLDRETLLVERKLAKIEVDGEGSRKPLARYHVALPVNGCCFRQQPAETAIVDDREARIPDVVESDGPQIGHRFVSRGKPGILPPNFRVDIRREHLLAVVYRDDVEHANSQRDLLWCAAFVGPRARQLDILKCRLGACHRRAQQEDETEDDGSSHCQSVR